MQFYGVYSFINEWNMCFVSATLCIIPQSLELSVFVLETEHSIYMCFV